MKWLLLLYTTPCLWTLTVASQDAAEPVCLSACQSSSHVLFLNDLHSQLWLKWSWAAIILLLFTGAMSACAHYVKWLLPTFQPLCPAVVPLKWSKKNIQLTSRRFSRLQYHFFVRSLVKKPSLATSCSTLPIKKKNAALDSHPRLSSTAFQYSRETTVQMSAVHGDRAPPAPLSSTSLPAGTQTVSSRLKYFCRASLRLCPVQLMHHLIQHNNTLGGLLLVGLLMSYRYSLLPPMVHDASSSLSSNI